MDSPPAPEQDPRRYGRRLFLATVVFLGVVAVMWATAS